MNTYRVCLTHVPGILAMPMPVLPACPPASSSVCICSVRTGMMTGYLARGQDTHRWAKGWTAIHTRRTRRQVSVPKCPDYLGSRTSQSQSIDLQDMVV